MTASEILKGMKARLEASEKDPNDWDSGPFGITDRAIGEDLVAALPFFIDLLEAAERLIFDNGTRSRQQMWRDSEAALLRLEKHLEGGDVT